MMYNICGASLKTSRSYFSLLYDVFLCGIGVLGDIDWSIGVDG